MTDEHERGPHEELEMTEELEESPAVEQGGRPEGDADPEPAPGGSLRDALGALTTRHRVGLAVLLLVTLGSGVWLGRSGSSSDGPAAEPTGATGHENHSEAAVTTWTCSMHPQVQSPEPGSCPICGMDLIPAQDPGSGAPLGPAQVRLTRRAQSLARIRTEAVTTSSMRGAPRELLGRVVEDEGSLRAVTSWIAGRVDRLSVSTTGARVRRGQTLARMYSPEVYAAHQDLLVGVEQLEDMQQADPYAQRAARGQVASARQRLRLLGFSGSELAKMERADEPWTRVSIRSTATGTVMRRNVRQGEYVQKGAVLFELSDLETVWVELDAYESDLQAVEVGQEVSLTVDALEGSERTGTVTFIDPVLDPRTRVASLRIEVPNADGRIKPGMYVSARLESELTPPGMPLPLVIPRSAPLFAGERSLVYVEVSSETEGATYEAREVELGARLGERYVVRAGLSRGERVVTHGAFALDSDLQIRGNLSLMARHDDTSRPDEPARIDMSVAGRKALTPLLVGYLDIGERLADDELEGARSGATRLRETLSAIDLDDSRAKKTLSALSRRMSQDLERLEGAEALDEARAAFSGVTEVLDEVLARFGNVLEVPIRKAFCPMANGNEGDHWYQRAEEVDNVYFGNQMRQCGEIQQVVNAGAHILAATSPDLTPDAPGQGGGHVH